MKEAIAQTPTVHDEDQYEATDERCYRGRDKGSSLPRFYLDEAKEFTREQYNELRKRMAERQWRKEVMNVPRLDDQELDGTMWGMFLARADKTWNNYTFGPVESWRKWIIGGTAKNPSDSWRVTIQTMCSRKPIQSYFEALTKDKEGIAEIVLRNREGGTVRLVTCTLDGEPQFSDTARRVKFTVVAKQIIRSKTSGPSVPVKRPLLFVPPRPEPRLRTTPAKKKPAEMPLARTNQKRKIDLDGEI